MGMMITQHLILRCVFLFIAYNSHSCLNRTIITLNCMLKMHSKSFLWTLVNHTLLCRFLSIHIDILSLNKKNDNIYVLLFFYYNNVYRYVFFRYFMVVVIFWFFWFVPWFLTPYQPNSYTIITEIKYFLKNYVFLYMF